MFTHALDAGTFSPRLLIKSPEKRCGKTTLLRALTEVCRRPLPTSNITAPALFRTVQKIRPTLILDETDTFVGGNEELRGVINSGHSRSLAYVVRLVEVDGDFEPRKFSTWCPMATAGIGGLHGTIEDRSVIVELERKLPGETVECLDEAARGRLRVLARKARRWVDDHWMTLTGAKPAVPAGLHDRAADNWHPLLAVADAAGGEWPTRARDAAKVLSGGDDADTLATMLLADVRAIFFRRSDPAELRSCEIVAALVAMDHRPWPEASKGKPLTTTKLASLLKRFRIKPRHTETANVYRGEDFTDAWKRYLPPGEGNQPFSPSGTRQTSGSEGSSNPSAKGHGGTSAEGLEGARSPHKYWAAEGLKGSHPAKPERVAGERAEVRV
jgi:putative DNA primase/helicase